MAIEVNRLVSKVYAFQAFLSYIVITKQSISTDSTILNWINTFNSISKFMGFAVTKPDDKRVFKFLREIFFLLLLCFAAFCTVLAELWCMEFINMNLDVRRLVAFCLDQLVNLSPISCFVYFKLCDLPMRGIILKVKELEENLIICDVHLEIRRLGSMAIFFWFFQFFTITTMIICIWPPSKSFIVVTTSIFYFEAWATVPYLQFITWICFLCHVLHRLQLKIIEIYQLEFLKKLDHCRVRIRLDRTSSVAPGLVKIEKIRRIIDVMKKVLIITKKLSRVYGVTILLYVINCLSRIVLQAYSLLTEDAYVFYMSMRTYIFHMAVRIFFMLPVFICSEHLSYNINEIIELLREVVTLHPISCLNRIFQSLTLRLKHQSSTIQICGFLNLTYGSLLTITTTAIAFLVFQLQLEI